MFPVASHSTPIERFRTLVNDEANGTGEVDALEQLCALVKQDEKLQKRPDVLERMRKLYKNLPDAGHNKTKTKDQKHVALAILECAKHRKKIPPLTKNGPTKALITFASEFSYPSFGTPVVLRSLEIMPWEYKKDASIFGDIRHSYGYEDLHALHDQYTKLFPHDKNRQHAEMQQRAYDIFKKPAEQNITKKRRDWFSGDLFVLKLLQYPLTGSRDNFLQNDALNLSFRYIDQKMDDLSSKAMFFKHLAKAVQKDQPEISDFIAHKAAVTDQEAELQKTYLKFFEDGKTKTVSRQYSGALALIADNKNVLVRDTRALEKRQNMFEKIPVPDILR